MTEAGRNLEVLRDDIRFGLRILVKNPRFALVGIFTLALGIGANTAIFSVVNAVLLRQLPFRDPQKVVSVMARVPDMNQGPFSLPDFEDYTQQNESLAGIAALADWGANLTGYGDAERLQGAKISSNAFQVLGVDALIGRTLLPDDDRPDRPLVVVLTYGLWQRRFGADRNVLGQTIRINSEAYTIVGVLPPGFIFPYYHAELARPLRPESDPRRTDRASVSFLRGIGRLKPGVTLQQAQSQFTALALRLREQYPKFNANKIGVTIVPIQDVIIGNFQLILLVLTGAVALVLLIACTNMANLVLSKSAERYREIAVRIALGATRARIIGQLLTENVILSLLGGVVGFLFSLAAVPALLRLSPPNLPRMNEVSIDGRVLAFTIFVSIASGLIFGVVPALQAFGKDLNEALKEEGKGSTVTGHRNRTRSMLVIAEVGFSLVLLIGAGLLLRSLVHLQRVSPGFVSDHAIAVRLSLPQARYKMVKDILPFEMQIRGDLENLPGVSSVGTISHLPMSGLLGAIYFSVVGRPPANSKEQPSADYRMISPHYFQAMQIPLLSGRAFTDHDTAETQAVAIINATMARRFWPNGDAVGSHVTIDDANDLRTVEIVGVVSDVKHKALEADPDPELFVPIKQIPQDVAPWLAINQFWIVRASGDPMRLAADVRRIIHSTDSEVATDVKPLDDYLNASIAPRRFNLLLLGVFASTALMLTIVGIYGVMANLVSQRSREIGIRMALGAGRWQIGRSVILQGLKLVAIGVLVGCVASIFVTQSLSHLLFKVSPEDPITYGGLVLLIVIVSVFACSIPAFRAMTTDPISTLRQG